MEKQDLIKEIEAQKANLTQQLAKLEEKLSVLNKLELKAGV